MLGYQNLVAPITGATSQPAAPMNPMTAMTAAIAPLLAASSDGFSPTGEESEPGASDSGMQQLLAQIQQIQAQLESDLASGNQAAASQDAQELDAAISELASMAGGGGAPGAAPGGSGGGGAAPAATGGGGAPGGSEGGGAAPAATGGGSGPNSTGGVSAPSSQSGGSSGSAPSSVGPLTAAQGNIPANAQTMYKFFTSKGLSPNAAAGVIGNIYGESGGNPESVGSGGNGLIGWTPPLAGAVTGNPQKDLAFQLNAVMDYIKKNGSVADINANASSPAAAAQHFMMKYERPADPSADGPKREESANAVAAKFGGGHMA